MFLNKLKHVSLGKFVFNFWEREIAFVYLVAKDYSLVLSADNKWYHKHGLDFPSFVTVSL